MASQAEQKLYYSVSCPGRLVAAGLAIGLSVGLLGCTSSPWAIAGNTPAATQPSQAASLAQSLPISAEAQMGGHVIQLEVARTPQEQAKGLMYRASLPDDRGMLFPFSPARPVQFWMMNVPISLDMVFLRNGVVRYIAANVPPCTATPCPTYGPRVAIDQVIELRGGRAEELGLKVGDRVSVRFLESQP